MEPAHIDWKNVESRYVQDELYEHINAPKWLDLAAPDAIAVDDDAWFCRPDCRHPKTAEDFQRLTPSPKVKLLRSTSEALPLGERNSKNHRDASLKRRGVMTALLPSSPRHELPKPRAAPKKSREDLENQDPNICTPPPLPIRPFAAPVGGKTAKDAIKSSAEKREGDRGKEELQHRKPQPQLRSTLSARNLFSGKDIMGQISEFCNELKKLAMRKERNPATEGEPNKEEEEKKALLAVEEEQGRRDLKLNLNAKRNDGSAKKSSRMVMRVETEKGKCKKGGDENSSVLRDVRAWPPTPQRFPSPSSHHPRKAKASAITSSPLNKNPKFTAPERGVLQEVEESREDKRAVVAKDEDCNRAASDSPNFEGGRSEGLFWFLRPCNYLV